MADVLSSSCDVCGTIKKEAGRRDLMKKTDREQNG